MIPVLFDNLTRRRYAPKVLSVERANLLAYWPLWEPAGSVAVNLEGTAARNGTYSSVTLGQPGIGDRRTCPLFNGTSGHVDIYSDSFRDAFDGDLYSVLIWIKVFDSSVWSDNYRNFYLLGADAAPVENRVRASIESTDNQYECLREANNSQRRRQVPNTTLDWFNSVHTVDDGGDEIKTYLNGVQQGVTSAASGNWVGSLINTATYIGSGPDGDGELMHGWLAHMAVWNKVLTQAQITYLSKI